MSDYKKKMEIFFLKSLDRKDDFTLQIENFNEISEGILDHMEKFWCGY